MHGGCYEGAPFSPVPAMYHRIRPYFSRHEPSLHWRIHVKATAGAVLGVMVVGGLAAWTELPLLMAPLGATALLIFAHPRLPGAQPINVFMGYLLGAIFSSLAEMILPGAWWMAALAVGATMLAMLVLRVTHPPAAAIPLVIAASYLEPPILFGVMFAACLVLCVVAIIWHRLPPRQIYPLPRHKHVDVEDLLRPGAVQSSAEAKAAQGNG
jgi:CBS-domain-containing membrane protein